MMTRLFIVVLLSCGALAPAFGAEALKKIRIASKAPGEALLPYLIAQRFGFYREEGLDLETLLIRGSVVMQALIGC